MKLVFKYKLKHSRKSLKKNFNFNYANSASIRGVETKGHWKMFSGNTSQELLKISMPQNVLLENCPTAEMIFIQECFSEFYEKNKK